MKNISVFLFAFIFFIAGCSKENTETRLETEAENLTIFFVNDQHGQLDNFSKIKHIADLEKRATNVISL